MICYRDGAPVLFCEVCHAYIDGKAITEPGRMRSLRMVDKDRVTGEGEVTWDAAHFCSDHCAQRFVPVKRAEPAA